MTQSSARLSSRKQPRFLVQYLSTIIWTRSDISRGGCWNGAKRGSCSLNTCPDLRMANLRSGDGTSERHPRHRMCILANQFPSYILDRIKFLKIFRTEIKPRPWLFRLCHYKPLNLCCIAPKIICYLCPRGIWSAHEALRRLFPLHFLC